MSIFNRFSGVTAKTPKSLVLDAGAFCKNYDLTKDFAANKAAGNVICATQGGGGFSATPTYRQIQVDGMPSNWKGGEEITDLVATLNLKMVEQDAALAKLALGAAKTAAAKTPSGYTELTPKDQVEDEDYINNVCWVGKIRGSDKPVIIMLYNALALNGISWSFSDGTESITDCTLTAHYDPTATGDDAVLFRILYPTKG